MANDITPFPEAGVVLYQPNDNIRLEVRVDTETVWLSQAQMGQLFGTNRQAITKHIKNIYETGELNREAISSILELVQTEGNRKYSFPHMGKQGVKAAPFARLYNQPSTRSLTRTSR